ncbi:hypothetical protein E3E31_10760 [Thermococcus sp. M39]|uniref:hypothetical protein n=1 Tax=unclassified Thermococcus TaxID=2627626 RepID=UPI00143B3294|nr:MULTISPECIES: hypothetical protein [unclassified Thermococcus]NJE08994.1 hypothetical protein [Thermococcus sp. M39]NJE13358.1 hypothetical protein [Thermococcus sp. LS2]
MQENPGLVLCKWSLEEAGLITIREEKVPANRPRRYVKLAEDWQEALVRAEESEYEKLKEKWKTCSIVVINLALSRYNTTKFKSILENGVRGLK